MAETLRIQDAGEDALIVYWPAVSTQTLLAQRRVAAALRRQLGLSLIDLVPSYNSLLVLFDPFSSDAFAVRMAIRQSLSDGKNEAPYAKPASLTLPAYYSHESGPDLDRVAKHAGLSVEEVIERHCSVDYRVYAVGFAPGFAYLGDIDPQLAIPRLETPRARVPRGAVAIADRQTAVYPAASPGGWNLIGLCPTSLFTPGEEPCMPFAVGDCVRFRAISRDEYLQSGGALP